MQDSAWERLLRLFQEADDKAKFLRDIDEGLYDEFVSQVDEDLDKALEILEAIDIILSLDKDEESN